MGIDIPLQVHLDGFKDLSAGGKTFHLAMVHDSPEVEHLDEKHREMHLAGPVHGFKKGKVKA